MAEHQRTRLVLGVMVLAVLLLSVAALLYFVGKGIGLEASLLWTTLLGAAAWAIRTNIERTRAHEQLLAEQKRTQYFEFLDIMNQFMGRVHEPTAPTLSPAEFRRWSLRLSIIGSDEVLLAWNRARLGAQPTDGAAASDEAMRRWAELLLQMRRDCGHYGTKLRRSDMLATFVNDIDQYRSRIDGPGI